MRKLLFLVVGLFGIIIYFGGVTMLDQFGISSLRCLAFRQPAT